MCIIYKVAQKRGFEFGHWKLNNKEKETRTKKSVEISNNSLEKPSKKTYAKEQAIAWVEIKQTLREIWILRKQI